MDLWKDFPADIVNAPTVEIFQEYAEGPASRRRGLNYQVPNKYQDSVRKRLRALPLGQEGLTTR